MFSFDQQQKNILILHESMHMSRSIHCSFKMMDDQFIHVSAHFDERFHEHCDTFIFIEKKKSIFIHHLLGMQKCNWVLHRRRWQLWNNYIDQMNEETSLVQKGFWGLWPFNLVYKIFQLHKGINFDLQIITSHYSKHCFVPFATDSTNCILLLCNNRILNYRTSFQRNHVSDNWCPADNAQLYRNESTTEYIYMLNPIWKDERSDAFARLCKICYLVSVQNPQGNC